MMIELGTEVQVSHSMGSYIYSTDGARGTVLTVNEDENTARVKFDQNTLSNWHNVRTNDPVWIINLDYLVPKKNSYEDIIL